MSRPFFLVDAFTDRPFAGNPAGVVLMEDSASDEWLQNVASEMNQAETAFIWKQQQQFQLRWFTPAVEVDLCGHATLASAAAMMHAGWAKPGEKILFETRSGILTVAQNGAEYVLDFPAKPATKCDAPAGLLESLGVPANYVGNNRMDILAVFDDAATIRRLTPDLQKLGKLPVRGVICTAASDDPKYDFISRFFAPAAGVPEDSVTGSAHCCLADYWGKRLGKTSMTGFQASKRGGVVRVELVGDRVLLKGHAKIIVEGKLLA